MYRLPPFVVLGTACALSTLGLVARANPPVPNRAALAAPAAAPAVTASAVRTALPAPRVVLATAAQQAALGVRTTAIEPARALRLLATASVTVPPGREYSVTAPYAGVITRLEAGLGDAVRAGTPLARMSSPALAELRRQARDAQLELQNRKAAAERDQAMYDDGLIPAARLQLTLNRYRAAESAAQAQASMLVSGGATPGPEGADYAATTIRAAGPGLITDTQAAVGQRLDAGAVLFRVADLRELQLDLMLAPDKAARLRVGDKVQVALRGATAEITGIGRALDASQQAHARAHVRDGSRLQAGETLPVTIETRLPPGNDAAWQLPARALLTMAGRSHVLRAQAQGFELVEVAVLANDDNVATVTGPLNAGDRVAVTGLAALRGQLEAGE